MKISLTRGAGIKTGCGGGGAWKTGGGGCP